MKLYIAEKPSLGRAIAQALPKPHRSGEGYIEVGNGDVVSWCIGHLLEQAEPDDYDTKYKKWQLEHLPIVPEQWQLKPKPKTRKQLTVLRGLIKKAHQIVHAGDPDREGQLLVDEVIDYLGVKGNKKDSIERILINDLNTSAVKRALARPRSNKEFIPLSVSALARSRADWMFGMNMTRAYTIQGQKAGYRGVLSVGRVQTPLLGLVVHRDEEIEHFVSKPFYEVDAVLLPSDAHSSQGTFRARWQPSENCRPYQDEEGRVLSKKLAENVCARITHQPAHVINIQQKKKAIAPPLPFSLSSLQIDAAKAFGMSAKQVLDTCQSLYERHKLITYPRSDSRHLPKEQHASAAGIISIIGQNSKSLGPVCQNADASLKSKAWDDRKVDAHHAIIPTEKKISVESLSAPEKKLYELIARQYLFQFYPPYEYKDTNVLFRIAGGEFKAHCKLTLQLGWKTITQKEDKPEPQIPPLTEGDILHCESGQLIEKQTTPPQSFNDATLLGAMTGIARYVKDKELRKILKDHDGIGTEATRASIIELLFKRGFLQRKGKLINATSTGKALIKSLPESATQPDMTAHWEFSLNEICERRGHYQGFMQPLTEQLNALIHQACKIDLTQMQGLKNSASHHSFKKTYRKSVKKKTIKK